ncbi:MAG: glutamine synthetase family protein [Deltaproteobacteria bacterium]|jgi:glutamine synthetase|nr:glutamine synthetase family protein [Deltaproteobacteria bacterium]
MTYLTDIDPQESLTPKEAMAKAKNNVYGNNLLLDIDHKIKEHDIKYVRFEQYDLYGIPRSKNVPINYFKHYLEHGLNFYGGILTCDVQTRCAPGTGYGEEVTYGDARTIPDLSTFMVLPWVPNTARIIVDPHWYDGRPLMATPRILLKKYLKKYYDLGYIVRFGFEFEFYLFKEGTLEPAYGSQPIFLTLYNNFDIDYLYGMMDTLQAAGFRIITQNSEQGPGQQELNLDCRDGLAAVDEAQCFKYAIKEISRQYGYVASFMTKPYIDRCASGAHIHISLIDRRTGQNAFLDNSQEDGLSDLLKHFLAGIIEHAPANTVFTAPTVNCYKRYRPGVCAPTTATWGFENRSVGFRIKSTRGQSTHLENRLACAPANPYLSALSTLAAGYLGIKDVMACPPPALHDVWADPSIPLLPDSLEDSLLAFQQDSDLKEAYGPELVKVVEAMKNWDIKTAKENCPSYGTPEFKTFISEWEREEFLEIL